MGKETHGTDDFKYWANLAKINPERFEEERKQIIEEFISNAPEVHRERLRKIQWRVDRERERASNPLSSCIRIHQMMMDSVCGERGLIHAIRNVVHGAENDKKTLSHSRKGVVLPFIKK